jgi:hypothetical protein
MCTESKGKVLLKCYAKARKAYTGKQRTAHVKSDKSLSKSSSFTGKQNDRLHTMNEVEKSGLIDNQTFKSKDVIQLCISEEANLHGINTIAIQSDHTNITVIGVNFYVYATFTEKVGWRVQTAICREGDDILKIPPKDKYDAAIEKDRRHTLCTPIKSKYVVPFIKAAIGNNPSMAYQAMRDIMKPYTKDYALTDSVLQEVRDNAKLELFGLADDNVCYARGVATRLRELDHKVELVFGNQRETLKKATATVLLEEVERCKKAKEIMNKAEQLKFIKKWKTDNDNYLNNVFGMEDGPQFLFLMGILFATSSSKHLVPLLQDVIQADGAHASYEKYTLFLAYGTTANGNMSPLAFGLLFGNENTENWSKFWMFVKKVHPCIDGPTKTIVTDQDKGSIAAIQEQVPQAAQFHCSFHRCQNIIKKCRGGKGCTPLTALWMYNLLSSCDSVKQLKNNKTKYYNKNASNQPSLSNQVA